MLGVLRVLFAGFGTVFGHALFFLLVGPPIGAAALAPILLAGAVLRQALGAWELVSLFFFTVVAAYFVAGLPALATGAVVAILRRAGIRRIRSAGALVGAVASALTFLFVVTAGREELGFTDLGQAGRLLLVAAVVPGAVAGFVATSLVALRPLRHVIRPGAGARDDAVASLLILGHDPRAAAEAADAAIRENGGAHASAADLIARAARRLPPLQPDSTSS